MKTFYNLSRLPFHRVSAVIIDGRRIDNPKVSLTKHNIYFNMDKVPLSTIKSVFEDDNFVTLNDDIVLEFRAPTMKLNFRPRQLNAQQWADKLVAKYGNPDDAALKVSIIPLNGEDRKKVEDILHELSVQGAQDMKLKIKSKKAAKKVKANDVVIVKDKNCKDARSLQQQNEDEYKKFVKDQNGF